MEKYYRVAGLNTLMDTFGKTAIQAQKYLCERFDLPDIVIAPSRDKVRDVLSDLSEDDFEYYVTGAYFYSHLLDFSGLMLHASCVVVDGKAYCFTADSGTGKSTHTNLWLNMFGDRAYILNDDKPALRLEDGIWYAYGTPWSGKNDISVNARAPVAGIAVVERGDINRIKQFGGADAIARLVKQTIRPKSAMRRLKLLDNMDALIKSVPIWKLECNMDPDAAIVSYEAMSGKRYVKENLNEN